MAKTRKQCNIPLELFPGIPYKQLYQIWHTECKSLGVSCHQELYYFYCLYLSLFCLLQQLQHLLNLRQWNYNDFLHKIYKQVQVYTFNFCFYFFLIIPSQLIKILHITHTLRPLFLEEAVEMVPTSHLAIKLC